MTMEAVRADVAETLISIMLNTRYRELVQVANPPFLRASGTVGDYYAADTREAYALGTSYKTGQWRPALDALIQVAKQAYEYGFTQAELDRATAQLMAMLQSAYNERSTRKNKAFVDMALDHFLHQEPALSAEYSFLLYSDMVPTISLQELDETFRNFFPEGNRNLSIVMTSEQNENSNIPTEEELLAAYNAAWTVEVEPYEDDLEQRPLISQMPAPGRIVKTKENKNLDATEYYLSNGAKVVIKTTDFKADEIQMIAVSPGGTSLFDTAERPNFYALNTLVSMGGMGDFSTMELSKLLSGVRANVSAGVSSYTESISGSSNVEDFEKMLQLVYLRFTTTRVDSAQFLSWKSRTANSLKQSEVDPMRPVADTISYLSYGRHERIRRFTQEDLDRVDYLRALELYRQRFDNAADFTFIFIGNIDKEVARPLIEQYIATLPSTGRHEKANEKVMPKPRTGLRESLFEQSMEAPKTMVYIAYTGKEKNNLRNRMTMSILSQIMRVVYTETIREQEGGTYGVMTGGELSRHPKDSWSYAIQFDTNAEMAARLADRAMVELKKVADEGPSAETFDKVISYMVKSYQSSIKENGYWLSQLMGYYTVGEYTADEYISTLEKITTKDVQRLAKKIVSSPNLMKVIRYGIAAQ